MSSGRIPRLALRGARVSVVQSAEVGDGDDFTRPVFDLARRRRVAHQAQVRSRLVVVGRVSTKDTDEVAFFRLPYDVESVVSKIKAVPELTDWLGERLREGR